MTVVARVARCAIDIFFDPMRGSHLMVRRSGSPSGTERL